MLSVGLFADHVEVNESRRVCAHVARRQCDIQRCMYSSYLWMYGIAMFKREKGIKWLRVRRVLVQGRAERNDEREKKIECARKK